MVYSKLVNFLSNYPKKDKHTHTVYGGDIKTGAYTIPFDQVDNLHKLVAKAIHVKGDKISMVEKTSSSMVSSLGGKEISFLPNCKIPAS